MQTSPPNKIWCLVKAFLGVVLTATFAGGLLQDAYHGFAIAFVMGAFIGLGVRLVVTGALGVGGQRMAGKTSWGLALAVAVLCALVGPGVSASARKSAEAQDWAKVKDSRVVSEWIRYEGRYLGDAQQFRNPDWEAHKALAEATEGRSGKDAGRLRNVLKRAEQAPNKAAWSPAQKEATEGLSALFAESAKSLSRKGADPKLQKAFATVIEELAHDEDGKLYLVFDTRAVLNAPRGDAESLASMRASNEVLASFPKKDAPVIDAGDAFAHEYDQKRRKVLEKVLQEAFGGVFAAGLLEVTALDPKADRKDKPVLEIRNIVERVPDYFYRSRQGKVIGLMFGLEVAWQFNLYDRSGKKLFSGSTVSSPSTEVSFRLRKTDPEWAPYGIMVDSAYYNFGRLVTKSFGLTPPPEKKEFVLEDL